VEVGDDEVRLGQTLTNLSDGAMPGGIGVHPWFAGRVKLAIHSAQVYASNTASSAEPIGVSGALDLREPTEMEVGVDATWPLVSDPAVDMWWPDAGIHATLGVHNTTPHIVAANPGNRAAIAVEPETNAPQGLRRLLAGSPGALELLDPGAVLSLTSVIRFERSV
jgi:aldose 1-epimerase